MVRKITETKVSGVLCRIADLTYFWIVQGYFYYAISGKRQGNWDFQSSGKGSLEDYLLAELSFCNKQCEEEGINEI